jgi:hypothetical protein
MEWINNYAGQWIDGVGHELHILVHNSTMAYATLLLNGKPILRPWCKDKPSINMTARYRQGGGPQLSIDLGRKGFTIELAYDAQYELLPDSPEALSVGISRYENDDVAERSAAIFYPLNPFRRKQP